MFDKIVTVLKANKKALIGAAFVVAGAGLGIILANSNQASETISNENEPIYEFTDGVEQVLSE